MVTLKEQQFQLREQAIVTAMVELLAQHGYSATSMDDVAKRVGISKATLYLHFKSKADLALRIIIQDIEAAELSMKSVDPALSAIDRLMRTLDAGIQRRLRLGAARIEVNLEGVTNHPAFLAAEQRVDEATTSLIEEAMRQGDIRADLSPTLIQQFISSIFSMNFNLLMQQSDSIEQIGGQVVDLVRRAIRP